LTIDQVDCVIEVEWFFIGKYKSECGEECPLECTKITYDIQVTSSPYPTREEFERRKKANFTDKQTYEAFREEKSSVSVFYPSKRYTEIRQVPKITLIDLLANIGGSIGIFLGFSVFSLFEMVEIVFRLAHFILRKNK